MEHDIHVLYLILALVKFVTTGLDGIYVNETMLKICPENYWHFWLQVVWHSDKCQVSTHCSNLTSNSMKLDMAKCYNYLWLKKWNHLFFHTCLRVCEKHYSPENCLNRVSICPSRFTQFPSPPCSVPQKAGLPWASSIASLGFLAFCLETLAEISSRWPKGVRRGRWA